MIIGDYDISVIETGYISLDGGAMFGVVPKTLWQKNNPADEFNRIKLALRLLVLRSSERLIIIDTGVGNKLNEKLSKIYNVDYSTYDIQSELDKKSINPKEVTDVIITHMHFDHVGGATYYENNELKLTFPNAIHHIQGEQWYWGSNPSEKDKASFMPENFMPIQEQGKLNELPGPGTLYPGIDLLVMYGHTHGMQLPKIYDSKTTLLYCADLIPTASHIPLPYIMGYDNYPMNTLEEKRRILPQAVDENWILAFEHDPFCAAGTVELTDKGFKLKEEIKL
jgi:glyoxylase-like metal-dependent hydrolase (beta-lactamase superfamily II)